MQALTLVDRHVDIVRRINKAKLEIGQYLTIVAQRAINGSDLICDINSQGEEKYQLNMKCRREVYQKGRRIKITRIS